ncbi:hypothetical protein [Arcobacter vandammei]|nr:hypothetical protein [Arcobacter vandammei]
MKISKAIYTPKNLISLRKIVEEKLYEKKLPFYKKIFRVFFRK